MITREEKEAILSGLDSSDGEVRRLSVEQLLQLDDAEAVPLLAKRLGDEVWRVRKAAVDRLVRCIDHPTVQEILIASLADDDDPGRRNSAFEALVACGQRVTTRLTAELSNPDVDVRKLVVDALAAIGDPQTTDALLGMIADPDTNVRAAAVEALGRVGGPDEIDHVLRTLNAANENVLVRLSALRALKLLETAVPTAALSDALSESALRPAALLLLGTSEEPAAIDEMLKALEGSGRTSREAAMGALVRRLGCTDGEDAIQLLRRIRGAAAASSLLVESACERLEASPLSTRMVLIQFLGLLEDARVVIPILKAGDDDAVEELVESTLENLGSIVPTALDEGWDELDAGLRRRACAVLGRLGGEAADRRLSETLDAANPELRCAAATALGDGFFFERLPDLARRLEEAASSQQFDSRDEISVFMSAIIALAEHPEARHSGLDVQLIATLSSRLDGAPEPVRLAIAQVLARLGRPRDEDIIAYLLKDESSRVRRAAVQSLARFDFARSREALRLALGDESESVRSAAASVLGEGDDLAAVEDLERMTHDDDPRVVAVALRSLGHLTHRIGDPSKDAYPIIDRALSGTPIVAIAGLEALAELGGEGAAGRALSVMDRAEPEVVRAALVCVERHGSDDELSSLFALIPHPDWSVRAEVARVLAVRKCRKSLPALLRRLELEDDPFVREVVLDSIQGLEE